MSEYTTYKAHVSVLVGSRIAVSFGRIGAAGQVAVKDHGTGEKAAAAYWTLLRSKVAKGYRVEGATVGADGLPAGDLAAVSEAPTGTAVLPARAVLREVAEKCARQARIEHRAFEYGAGARERSPRTARVGKKTILALMHPSPDRSALIAAAAAPESERFARHLALAHPECPPEAEVAAALAGGTWSLLGSP